MNLKSFVFFYIILCLFLCIFGNEIEWKDRDINVIKGLYDKLDYYEKQTVHIGVHPPNKYRFVYPKEPIELINKIEQVSFIQNEYIYKTKVSDDIKKDNYNYNYDDDDEDIIFEIPVPDGTIEHVTMKEVSVLSIGERHHYGWRMYFVYGVEDPQLRGRASWNPTKPHNSLRIILSSPNIHNGIPFLLSPVDPVGELSSIYMSRKLQEGNEQQNLLLQHDEEEEEEEGGLGITEGYYVYWKNEYFEERKNVDDTIQTKTSSSSSSSSRQSSHWKCHSSNNIFNERDDKYKSYTQRNEEYKSYEQRETLFTRGYNLTTIRLAVATTAEYTETFADEVETEREIGDVVMSLNSIFGPSLSYRFVLIANNTDIISPVGSAATDPYTNNDINQLPNEAQSTINATIGASNFDLGIVLGSQNASGIAGGFALVGGVCQDSTKATAAVARENPTGLVFYQDFIAHEIGHLLGARHTYNSQVGPECNTRSGIDAYEPGSGSTVMAYPGLCGTENDVEDNVDPYFHHHSIEQMLATCPGRLSSGVQPTGKIPLQIDDNTTTTGNFTVPLGNFFFLRSGAINGTEPYTFVWEQHDLGTARNLNENQISSYTGPLFRSYPPSTDNIRQSFPRDPIDPALGDEAPLFARDISFRLVARDIEETIAISSDVLINIDDSISPLTITSSEDVDPTVGANYTVMWNVGDTFSIAPFLSIEVVDEDGTTYALDGEVPNDGSATFQIPIGCCTGNTARILLITLEPEIFFAIREVNVAGSSDTNDDDDDDDSLIPGLDDNILYGIIVAVVVVVALCLACLTCIAIILVCCVVCSSGAAGIIGSFRRKKTYHTSYDYDL